MIGHLGLNVGDLGVSKAYYDRLMPAVGFEPFLADADQIAYRPAGRKPGTYLFLYAAQREGDYSRHRIGLQHVAFKVTTRSAVRSVRQLVGDLGSEILEEPRDFPDYPPPYYATFWRDPNGFMLEAVCHHDRD